MLNFETSVRLSIKYCPREIEKRKEKGFLFLFLSQMTISILGKCLAKTHVIEAGARRLGIQISRIRETLSPKSRTVLTRVFIDQVTCATRVAFLRVISRAKTPLASPIYPSGAALFAFSASRHFPPSLFFPPSEGVILITKITL